jgi:hypothetical protein
LNERVLVFACCESSKVCCDFKKKENAVYSLDVPGAAGAARAMMKTRPKATKARGKIMASDDDDDDDVL